jgi:hypothetical protein
MMGKSNKKSSKEEKGLANGGLEREQEKNQALIQNIHDFGVVSLSSRIDSGIFAFSGSLFPDNHRQEISGFFDRVRQTGSCRRLFGSSCRLALNALGRRRNSEDFRHQGIKKRPLIKKGA